MVHSCQMHGSRTFDDDAHQKSIFWQRHAWLLWHTVHHSTKEMCSKSDDDAVDHGGHAAAAGRNRQSQPDQEGRPTDHSRTCLRTQTLEWFILRIQFVDRIVPSSTRPTHEGKSPTPCVPMGRIWHHGKSGWNYFEKINSKRMVRRPEHQDAANAVRRMAANSQDEHQN